MEETLNNLGFINISDETHKGYYKTFKGYKLFVAKPLNQEHWFATIEFPNQSISIPLTVNKFWVFGFNEENNGY